jgi:hypothetical protein
MSDNYFKIKYCLLYFSILTLCCQWKPVHAQTKKAEQYIISVAGKQYYRSNLHHTLWGKHYRKEWKTPALFKVVMLDTLAGGLTPYQAGGGRQSKSLRLRDANGREYVLRSIDKTFEGAFPEVVRGSFVAKIANDQVSIAHPYSALTIAPMAYAAAILHTNPVIIYVPKQARLGQFNDTYGDVLYLFEQRPDENWSTASNFGNSVNIIGTDDLLEKLEKDNDVQVDQLLYVRSRIFDMFIGDWGRHEDQWRWAANKQGGQTIYKPIPRDRDQAYTKFDGLLVGTFKGLAGGKFQSFGNDIKNVTTFNYPARYLDRRMANEVTQQQWVAQATEIQQALTDKVIESAINRLPPEIFPISGNEIINKLKQRRNTLVDNARDYYLFLAKEVDVPGSGDNEKFEVKRNEDGSTLVNIYKITNEGKIKEQPFYLRTFYSEETKEIRLYGLDASDVYEVSGNAPTAIKVRLIGGPAKDEYKDLSKIDGSSHTVKIYDNLKNTIIKGSETGIHLSKDSAINQYRYDAFHYNKSGIKPLLFYSNEDHFFTGLEFGSTKYKWRKEPFAFKQKLNVKYSISEKAFSASYQATFTDVIKKWDLNLYTNYDFVRWLNFYGLGNETTRPDTTNPFNRLRTTEYIAQTGFSNNIGRYQKISLSGFYQTMQIKNDTAFNKSLITYEPDLYKTKQFAGAEIEYSFLKVNDSLLPTKGFGFAANITYTDNLENSNNFIRYEGVAQAFLPFTKTLGLYLKLGGATLTGSPEFYQYNFIGGGKTLRGYRRSRFFGKTTAYSQNEIRWVKDVRSYLYNGKFGLLALYDIGRAWMPGERSNTWHSGVGGGIILAPYNRTSVSIGYAYSSEKGNIFFRLIKIL